jgi:hypothetical protein
MAFPLLHHHELHATQAQHPACMLSNLHLVEQVRAKLVDFARRAPLLSGGGFPIHGDHSVALEKVNSRHNNHITINKYTPPVSRYDPHDVRQFGPTRHFLLSIADYALPFCH